MYPSNIHPQYTWAHVPKRHVYTEQDNPCRQVSRVVQSSTQGCTTNDEKSTPQEPLLPLNPKVPIVTHAKCISLRNISEKPHKQHHQSNERKVSIPKFQPRSHVLLNLQTCRAQLSASLYMRYCVGGGGGGGGVKWHYLLQMGYIQEPCSSPEQSVRDIDAAAANNKHFNTKCTKQFVLSTNIHHRKTSKRRGGHRPQAYTSLPIPRGVPTKARPAIPSYIVAALFLLKRGVSALCGHAGLVTHHTILLNPTKP